MDAAREVSVVSDKKPRECWSKTHTKKGKHSTARKGWGKMCSRKIVAEILKWSDIYNAKQQ
jgi:hypothetical protein